MQHSKHTAIALGALVCTVLLALPLGIGQTQARYEDTVSWKGVYSAEKPTLSSNFLAEGGRQVLLKDWEVSSASSKTLGIQLESDGEMKGTLSCQVDSDLITAKVDQDMFTVDKTGDYATLMLSAADHAAQLTEETVVTVRVNWIPQGEEGKQPTVWADFMVKLIPSLAEDETQTPVAPISPSQGTMEIACPDTFAPQERLALKLTLPEGADQVVLSFDGAGFPENTCYAVDDELSRVLADKIMITIPTEGRQEMQVILDFSWTLLPQNTCFLSAAAYTDGAEIAAAFATLSKTRQALEVEMDSAAIVMGANAHAQLSLNGDLDGFVWKLEKLGQTGGAIGYAASDALKIQIETENNSDGAVQSVLTVINEQTHAAAGTYRLTLQRVYDGVALSSIEIPIFVCY